MPTLKAHHIMPTPEEDAAITAAAMTDPDAIPLTDAEWDKVKPSVKIGRPLQAVTKAPIKLRLDPDIIAAFKAGGRGWQTRITDTLRKAIS